MTLWWPWPSLWQGQHGLPMHLNGEKLLKWHLKGKASKKLANGQNIDYSEKRKRPKGFICPCTGVKYHNIQTCLLVYAADSGERLQDHWSSGYIVSFLSIYVPPTEGGGHIVFGAVPVGVGVGVGVRVGVRVRVASFLRDIFWTSGWILTKLA